MSSSEKSETALNRMGMKKANLEERDRLTFRLKAPYQRLVAERAKAVGMSPHQFGKFATMVVADHEMLELKRDLQLIRDELIRIRKDLNEALYEDGC